MWSGREPSVAVVIPTLNEERTIGSCLQAVGQPTGISIVVSDGGSTDDTLTIVATDFPAVSIVKGTPGRGGQLERGARAAPAEAYVFVHSDCRLPGGWHGAVCDALADPGVAIGCFRLHTEPPPGGSASMLSRTWWRLLDLRSRGLGLPYGDQALFLRHDVFAKVGGVPRIPLMEDVELVRRSLGHGRLARLPFEVRTTARRFARMRFRAPLCTMAFPTLYRLGVSPSTLARWYRNVR
jgi:glycosyltransferase involved in cell wall biosynthesis